MALMDSLISPSAGRNFARRRVATELAALSLASLLPGEELIRSFDAVDIRPLQETPGTVTISNYQVSFATKEAGYDQLFYRIPHGIIGTLKVEKNRVSCRAKDCRDFTLEFGVAEDAQAFYETLSELVYCGNLEKRFAFVHRPVVMGSRDGWKVYNEDAEMQRMELLAKGFRFTEANADYRVCDSYPRRVIVANAVTDQDVASSAGFRRHGRFPAVTWRHPHTGSILVRSGQPLVGVQGSRCLEDERVVAAAAECCNNHLQVYDARRSRSALFHKLGGAGTESRRYNMEENVKFCNIRNMHRVRESFFEFLEHCRPLAKKTLRNLRRLEGVRQASWFADITQIITSSISIALSLHKETAAVLVHCSDGWNRTTQLVCLAQLLLDPYYRTINGFAVLIEKEWCSFGHRFPERHDFGVKGYPTNKFSPIFLQFLDCVWQILQQIPSAFEFNDRLLLCIIDSALNGRHGTFLFHSAKEASSVNATETTPSLWTEVFPQRQTFENSNYKPMEGMILSSFALASAQLWESFYLRYMGDDWIYKERYAENIILSECGIIELDNSSDYPERERTRSFSSMASSSTIGH